MPESFTEYKKRILGYLGERDPITVQQSTPAGLARLIRGVSRRRLARRPAPTKWSVLEIVAHLADTEIAMAWRLRNMLATPEVRLQWFDQDRWVRACSYRDSDPRKSVALFRVLRESNLALLRSVPRRKWTSCYGVHDVRGRQTVLDFVTLEAAHDLNHLRQIERIVGAHHLKGVCVSGQPSHPYETRLNVLRGPLEKIDVKELVDACTFQWYNQTLCRVNDSVVRLGVVQGEYHWHKHDEDDEFFYVVSGQFIIELDGRTVTLGPQQGFVVPKGVMHRPRAPERTVILMVETAGIVPTGD